MTHHVTKKKNHANRRGTQINAHSILLTKRKVKSKHFKDLDVEGNIILKDVAGCNGLIWLRTGSGGPINLEIP
jgi:hypothetical protein